MAKEEEQIFDYIIVGGGSAGCVLANKLSENHSVALLEAGPPDTSPAIHMPAGLSFIMTDPRLNWCFETEPQKGFDGRRGYQPRGKTLGGSSSINGMVYIRGVKEDYDAWEAQGCAGWGWDSMLPYFKATENQERGADEHHGEGGLLNVADLRSPSKINELFFQAAEKLQYRRNDDFNSATQEGVGYYQVTQKGGRRCSAAAGFLRAAEKRATLKIFTNARTTKILLENKKAQGVEFVRDKKTRTLKAAREVILSAGAFQSPHLLLLSGIGDGALLQNFGIDVAVDNPAVGKNLQDHADFHFTCATKPTSELFGSSLASQWRGLKGLWDYNLYKRGAMTTGFAESGGFFKSTPEEKVPDLQWHFTVAPVLDHGRKKAKGSGFALHFCVLRPQSRGTVSLGTRDALANPLIDPAFLTASADVQKMVQGFKLTRAVLEQEPLASLITKSLTPSAPCTTDEEIIAQLRAHSDTIYHPVGTCKMGTGDDAVVAPDLRVKGVEGLRVVDASVMPTLIGGNTNAPTIALAAKASDIIQGAH